MLEEAKTEDGIVCVLSSEVYYVHGSVGADASAMAPHRIAVDTCSGYNLVERSRLPKGWETCKAEAETLPRLAGAERTPLRLTGLVYLAVRLANNVYRVPFYVVEKLAVPVLLGTAFIDTHVKTLDIQLRRVNFVRGGFVPILGTNSGAASKPTNADECENVGRKRLSKKARRDHPDSDHDTHVVRLAKGLVVPPMSQIAVKAVSDARGLVYLEPKPTLHYRHGIRVANGILEIGSDAAFDVIVSNFTKRPRRLHKGTIIAFAQRNPIAVLTPGRELAEDFAKVLHLETLPNHVDANDATNGADKNDGAYADTGGTTVRDTGQANAHESRDTGTAPTSVNDDVDSRESDVRDVWQQYVDLSHVEDPELRTRIMSMLESHASMWDGKLGTIRATEHRINVEAGTKPIRSMPYRQGPAIREIVKVEITKMLDAGVIEPATSEWASPVVLVPKKDGSLRFCVDYRRLNTKTLADAYPLPRMDDCIDSLGDAHVFSTLDCNSGYWQIPVADEDRDKTTFTSYLGTFRYLRMPFGLKNAPATFQRALDIILSGVRWQICLVYLDDVIVFSRTHAEHVEHLDTVLTLLRNAGVSLKLKKCQFFRTEVEYLGHVIGPGTLRVSAKSTEALRACAFPKSLTQVRSFLGACNVFRRFVKDFSKIARPLTTMTRKDASPDFANPSDEQLRAFETLKERLTSPPVLALPKIGRPYVVDTDASAYQLGCALLQQQDVDVWKPVGYWSYTLTDTERDYSPTERECYAVVWAVTTLRPYLEGVRFTVRTDHDCLRWLMNLTESTGRLTRWRLRLSEFDFEIQYRPGRVHQVPDALSRLIRPHANDAPDVDDDIPHYDDATSSTALGTVAAVTDVTSPVVTRSRNRATKAAERGNTAGRSRDGTVRETRDPATETANQRPDVGAMPLDDIDDLPDVLDDDGWDDCDDVDPFDLLRVREEDEPTDWTDVAPVDKLPTPLTLDEIREAQRSDSFCQTVLSRQGSRDTAFFEDTDGVLKRHPRLDLVRAQIVLPETLRPRLLTLAHHSLPAGHPGQNRMYYTVRQTYYWPQMAADVAATVRNCRKCARNRILLRRHLNRLRLFPATRPLEAVAIDILGPLPKTDGGFRFLVIITDRFTKLSQVVPLRRITAYHVAVAFCEAWVFKYGPPATLLSDNGKQFTSRLFHSVCNLIGTNNVFTSAYHPQTNGQVERYNRTLLAMLRNFVNDHQNDWDRYASVLTYSYNCHVHRSTRTKPFDLVLSRPPPDFTLAQASTTERPDNVSRFAFLKRLDVAITKARAALTKTQQRYKRDFDKRVRQTNQRLRPGDFVYLNPTEDGKQRTKLTSPAVGPYRVLLNDDHTVYIDRDGLVERVSANRVVYAPPPANVPKSLTSPADLTEKVTEGPKYTVERLLEHERSPNGQYRFRVKWADYETPTWEERKYIPEEVVSRYFSELRRKHARFVATSDAA